MAGDLEIDIDDFGLRDEDFLGPQESKEGEQKKDEGPAKEPEDEVMEVEPPIEGTPRPEAIHVQGVDELSTADVQQFVRHYVAQEYFKIEWINDSSGKGFLV
jgi:DNA-dependent RNA polymerase auxiliary subunit epsilon